ncbi:MAG: hypothetical protein ABSF22_21125 [Bryobacteraceae bacterium]
MSTRNFGLFALAAILTGSAFAQNATISRTSSFTFPLVALAPTENIEVNLINLATNPTNGNASSCTGTVTFSTASQGTAIGGATSFTLAADAVASITPSVASNVITAGANRVLLKVVVASTTTPSVPCSLSYALNTFDSTTGVTHVFLVGAAPAGQITVVRGGPAQ